MSGIILVKKVPKSCAECDFCELYMKGLLRCIPTDNYIDAETETRDVYCPLKSTKNMMSEIEDIDTSLVAELRLKKKILDIIKKYTEEWGE